MRYDIDAYYENMRKVMQEKNISPKEIYNSVGMAQSNFSNAFNRKNGKHFSIEQMLEIADCLDCSLDFLFTKKEYAEMDKYIRVPAMSKWTCPDLLEMIFSLRKAGAALRFGECEAEDLFGSKHKVTTLYFMHRMRINGYVSGPGFYDDMVIDTTIREWVKMLESTQNIDDYMRENMRSTWEKSKMEQLEEVLLTDKKGHYELDPQTKKFHRIVDTEHEIVNDINKDY